MTAHQFTITLTEEEVALVRENYPGLLGGQEPSEWSLDRLTRVLDALRSLRAQPDYGRERRLDPHASWTTIYQRAHDRLRETDLRHDR